MATPDRERAKRILTEIWKEVSEGSGDADSDGVSEKDRTRISELLSSEAVTFTYCLPT